MKNNTNNKCCVNCHSDSFVGIKRLLGWVIEHFCSKLLMNRFGPEVRISQMNRSLRLQLKTFQDASGVIATQPGLRISGG